jgi:RHS repeat-associated protein
MKATLSLAALISLSILASTAIAQQPGMICRPNRGTIPCHTGPQDQPPGGSGSSCDTFGDPVTVGSLKSSHRVVDFVIDTPVGPFEFKRQFFSSERGLYSAFESGLGVLPPFGQQPGQSGPLWWHELFSLIGQPARPTENGLYQVDGGPYPQSAGVVRYLNGESAGYHEFLNEQADACRPPATCWWPRQYTEAPYQLQSTSSGYRVLWPDGTERFFEAMFGFASSDGGVQPLSKKYLLSRIQTQSGATLANIVYQAPSVSGSTQCRYAPAGAGGSVGVSPYIRQVLLAGGHELHFNYQRPPDCVLQSIDYKSPGSAQNVRLVDFGYDNSLRLISAIRPSSGTGEVYGYQNQGFQVYETSASNPVYAHETVDAGAQQSRNVQEIVTYGNQQRYTVGGVVSVLPPSYQVNNIFVWGHLLWGPQTQSGEACYAAGGGTQSVGTKTGVTISGGAGGESDSATSQYSIVYDMAPQIWRTWRYRRIRDVATCSTPACSPGERRYELRGVNRDEDGGFAWSPCNGDLVVSAWRDKNGSWELNRNTAVTLLGSGGTPIVSDGGFTLTLPSVKQRGLREVNSLLADPLESEQLEYSTFPNGRFAVSRKLTPPALGTAQVETKYFWNTSGAGKVLEKVITTGSTKDAVQTWTTVQRKRAVFFRRNPADPLKRVTAVEGPCWVASESDTNCLDANSPRTTYEYHGSAAQTNSERVSAVVRFSAPDAGQRIEFSNYTPEGEPRTVLDVANNIRTTYAYQDRLVTSESVQDLTTGVIALTEWTYDNEEVKSIRYPEGNYEVFCYRASAFPDCTGPQKSGLRWRAKVDNLTGVTFSSGWSERIEYSYNDSGEQVEERHYSVLEPEKPRYSHRTNRDLHGRPTYSRTGTTTDIDKHFATRAHFDGADNRDALAPAFVKYPNSPLHEYCLTSSGSPSPECWWFRHDRANRVNQATSPGTSPNRMARSCFDYSPAGNLSGVATSSAQDLSCDPSLNTPGATTSLLGADSTGITYQWDDFGNVISVFNSATDAPGTQTRYVFDARGNVVERSTPAMGATYVNRITYDGRDRLTELRREGGGSPVVLYTLEYDTTSKAPTLLAKRTAGRLARRIDSYGSTWYSYDSLGNVESEQRLRNSCNTSKGAHCSPTTEYTWDRNGNLTTVRYPFGRLVTYTYGSGGLRDRVVAVSVGIYQAVGVQNTVMMLSGVAWEPYGGIRGYTLHTVANQERLALEYYRGPSGTPPEDCDVVPPGSPDGTGRTVALLLGQGPYVPNQHAPVVPSYFSQKWAWTGDQVARALTCLRGRTGTQHSVHRQQFEYDELERMTLETSENTPRIGGDATMELKVFDIRGNRVDESEDYYDNLESYYSSPQKDRLGEQCWWRHHVNPNECLVSYSYGYNAGGAINSIAGLGGRWTMGFGYSHERALSDVYSSVTRGGAGALTPIDMYYDAFNRRRYKSHALGFGQEFYYGLEKNLLVDQAWNNSKGVKATLDEYVWLDGRPVIAIRSKVDGVGVHEGDAFEGQDLAQKCSRPMDDGAVSCGVFHLVTNLQSFPVLAISNVTGRVASFMLPDADGSVNSSRMMAYGGQGIAWPFRFDLDQRFRKQARFRSSWTGPNGSNTGVQSFSLNGTPVLTPNGQEVGRAWSQWGPIVGGLDPVTWSVTCPTPQDCASGSDAFEWRAWEDGAEQFHTRLRFPGQYHDAETDFYENWHRYYDPFNGRYLSPEPLLQSPSFVRTMLKSGHQVPAYAYAANNPSSYVDPDGLRIRSNVSVSYDYTTPGPRPNTRFSSYSGGHTGCQKVGGKWKFDATVNSMLDVFMAGKADRGSLNDGNACSIADHEEKHVQDYVEGLEGLEKVFKSEGFRSQAECERAVRSFEQNLRPYIDFLTGATQRMRDPFDFAR